jgi:hypothetical protein
MKMNVKFKIGGREVPLSRAGAEMAKALKADVSSKVAASLSKVRCPIHNVAPKNIRVESRAGRVRWLFDACCSQLEREAGKVLK